MSADKWKQIQRNLAEQESFVQSIIEQRQKKNRPQNNANIDNILSSSIQKAKQKISLIDSRSQPPRQDRSFENLGTSRDKKQKNTQQGSAIAAAMKKLQQRISNLQIQNKRLENQNVEIKKRQQNQFQVSNNLKRNLEENKRKVKNLQSSIEKDKNWIKQLQKKNENLQRQLAHKKLDNQNQALQTKLSTSQMMLRAQQQQFKNLIMDNQCKQKLIMQLQNKKRQEQIRFTQQLNLLKSINRQLELKVAGLDQRNKQKDILIQSFKHQIKGMEAERLKQSTIANYSKIDYEAEEDKVVYQNKSKRRQTEISHQQSKELEQLKQKYQQLFIAYKSMDEKSRQDKTDAKNYRNKFWQLKQAVKELIQKIHSLPSGVNAQLKYMIVKINKIQTFSADYFAATPTKSARKSSLLNNSTSRSKSKSNSKKKQMKLDLNRSNNSVKSKRSSNTNRSAQSKKSTKSKQKHVIVSQKTIKKNQISDLQLQIQQIRKRYKQLVMAQGKGNQEVSEEIRQQLNNLAICLQQKSQELTKLKRKK